MLDEDKGQAWSILFISSRRHEQSRLHHLTPWSRPVSRARHERPESTSGRLQVLPVVSNHGQAANIRGAGGAASGQWANGQNLQSQKEAKRAGLGGFAKHDTADGFWKISGREECFRGREAGPRDWPAEGGSVWRRRHLSLQLEDGRLIWDRRRCSGRLLKTRAEPI
jgi:hypothetical protein